MYSWGVVHFLTGAAAEAVDSLRMRFDPETAAVVNAHVTLAGGFQTTLPAKDYAGGIASVASRFHAFTIALDGFDTFMPTSCANFARLDEVGRLVAIHDALIQSLQMDERYPYHPHVTITEYLGADDTIRAQRTLSHIPLKVTDLVAKLSLVEKDADGKWQVVQEFSLAT